MTSITVMGPVSVGDAGPALAPRDRVVLSVLVARRGREVSADTLAEALWGDEPPASASKVVQGCVARLRRRLGTDAIVTGRAGYRLTVPAEDIDAGRFEYLVQRARELSALEHWDQAAYAADEALGLWLGEPLGDLEEWEPGRGEAHRLRELRLQAEELHLSALLASGRPEQALPEAAQRLREEPVRERRWALLARAQYQSERQAEALATIRRARQVLADELGLDPGRELVELERAILSQEPSLAVPSAVPSSPLCPWPGLAPYDVQDAEAFFGREAELHDCLARLARSGFLAIVGPSGSGKSSLVRAGIGASLQRDGRPVAVITPDLGPLLGVDGLGHGATPVLIVDQCEEVLDPSVSREVRKEFFARVAEHVPRAPVVIVLRADRLGELAAYPGMVRLVEESLYLLEGMGETALRRAIEEPAAQAGLLLEHGLVDLLVRDVEGEPGSLPLLAHALRQTWERREGHTLTVAAYRASGGIRGAVAQSAEQVYESISTEQRAALRELLLRLVQQGPAGEPVRTSVPRAVLASDPEHVPVLERLVSARLVTVAEDRLEIAHEALARAWPRLRTWLSDDVEGERIRHHLAAAAEGWDAMGRPGSELYRGARLAAALEWRDGGTHRLSEVEAQFLADSQRRHQADMVRIKEEARRQRRMNRRLRALVVGVALLALVATAVGGLAVVRSQEATESRAAAEAEADRAQTEASRARAHELAASAVAVLDTNPSLAKALAVAGAEVAPASVQSTGALHQAYAADRIVSRVSMNHFANRLWAVLHPDGTRIAMTGETAYQPAQAIEVHDALTGELIWEWVRPDEPGYESVVLAGAAYTVDGSVLATGVAWNPYSGMQLVPPSEESPPPPDGVVGIHLWDAATHESLGVLDVGPCGGWPIEVTATNVLVRALVAPAGERGSAPAGCRWDDEPVGTYVVDRATGARKLLGHVALQDVASSNVALSLDGTTAAVWDDKVEETVVVDTASGAEVTRISSSIPHDLDRTGAHVLVAHYTDSGVRHQVVSVADQRVVAQSGIHPAFSLHAAFGPEASTVLSTAMDNVLTEWDARTGDVLRRVPAAGNGRPSWGGRFRLAPRSGTYGAVLVDAGTRGESWSVESCGGQAWADQLRVAQDRVLVGRNCPEQGGVGRLESFDLGGGDQRDTPDAVLTQGLEVSPDGRFVVSQSGRSADGLEAPVLAALTVRDVATGEVTLTLDGFCEHQEGDMAASGCAPLPATGFGFDAWRIRWSPDGRFIAAVDLYTGALAVWDAGGGGHLATLVARGSMEQDRWGGVFDIIFSPDSEHLVMATRNAVLAAVDTTSWQVDTLSNPTVANLGSHAPVGYAADGSVVVISPYRSQEANTSLLLVDPDTLTVSRIVPTITEGSVRAAAVSPDGSRLALATSEGFAAVWDLSTGQLLDQVDPGLGRLQGVQWLGDHDLVLLGNGGEVTTVTTDPDGLLDLVRRSLSRGLTTLECTSYGFPDCPDLAQLRHDPPTVPAELRGSYELSWTAEDLLAVFVAYHQDAFGTSPPTGPDDLFSIFAADLAGDYRFVLSEAAYSLSKDGEEFCVGSVAKVGGRLLLGSERGSWCLDFHFAELGWRLDGDRLQFPREEFRGPQMEALVLTTKPWQRER